MTLMMSHVINQIHMVIVATVPVMNTISNVMIVKAEKNKTHMIKRAMRTHNL